MNYYIADLHIGHKNVLKHDNRPFGSCEEMAESMIQRWNNAVSQEDSVYLLGDVAWKNAEGLAFLRQVRGRKYLIQGNHDKPTQEMKSCFEWIKDYAVIKDGETEVVLFHYPIAGWYNQFRGAVHLYGHVHGNCDYTAYQRYLEICGESDIPNESYNVGCMMPYMDYTPRTLAEIRSSAG